MTRRILLIEGNIASMELMFHLLTSYGYSPMRARNGDEGLRIAAREHPDLVVSDLNMPFVDGYEVARRLRDDPGLSGIPLLAVSAFAMPEDRNKALAAGFDGYVAKPISPETFARHIEAFLRPDFRVSAASTQTLAAGAPPPAATGRKVLVVDDTPANLKLASRLLGTAGYQVTTAQGMSEALRLARNNPPDLIVSDVIMLDGSGYEFIRAVKADPKLRAIPFIFNSSSMAVESARKKGLALGARRFLFRPMDTLEMLQAIESCLDEAA